MHTPTIQRDSSQRRRPLADITDLAVGAFLKCVQLSNDVALAAVRKDAVALHWSWRKPVLAFTLLVLVVLCDWGSSN